MSSTIRTFVRGTVALVVSLATISIAAPPPVQAQEIPFKTSVGAKSNTFGILGHSNFSNIDVHFWLKWLLRRIFRHLHNPWNAAAPTADITFFMPGTPEATVASGLVQTMNEARAGQFAGIQSRPFSADAQRALVNLSPDLPDGGTAGVNQLVSALMANGNAQADLQAEVLVQSFQNLLVYPEDLHETVIAFNAFVDASSEEFLRAPTDEFLALHSSLDTLIEAANETIALR